MALKRFDEAIDACSQAIDLGAQKAISRLANVLVAVGEFEAAYSVASAVAGTSTDSAIQEAQKNASTAINLIKSLPSAMLSWSTQSGLVTQSAAHAEQASTTLLSLLLLAPYAEHVNFAFAQALLACRRYEAASRVLRAIERLRNDAVQGIVSRERVISLPAPTAAAVTISPPAPGAVPSLPVLLAKSFLGTGDFTAAQNVLESALRADPDGTTTDGRGVAATLKAVRQVNASKDKAAALYKEGAYDAAAAAYAALAEEAAAKFGFEVSLLHANVAAAYMAGNRFEDGLSAAIKAVQAWPANGKAWSRVAKCASSSKPPRYDAAVAAIVAYQHLQPDDSEANKDLFRMRAKAGDDDSEHGASLLHLDNDQQYQAIMSSTTTASKSLLGKSIALPSLLPSSASTAPGAGGRLAIVDWFATWCGPCKMIGPHFEQIARGSGVARYLKADGDKCRASAAGGAAAGGGGGCGSKSSGQCCGGGSCETSASATSGAGAGVRAFPTFISYLDGRELSRFEGADPKKLSEFVKDAVQAWKRAPPQLSSAGSASAWASAVHVPAITEAMAAVDVRPDVVPALAAALKELEQ